MGKSCCSFCEKSQKLGIDLKTRVTDLSLYKQRVDNFDYDMLVHWYLSGQNPGNELFNRYSSISADQKLRGITQVLKTRLLIC